MITKPYRSSSPFPVAAIVLAVSLVVGLAAPAAAERNRRNASAEARQRFVRGVELYESGAHSAALAEFTRAYELRPHFALLLNIAQCYSNIDRPAEAIEHLERYLREGGARIPGARRREVETELRRLEQLFSTLQIRVDVEGAIVTVDDREVGRTPLPEAVRVRSGLRVVEARLEGYRPARRELTIAGGDRVDLELSLVSIVQTARLLVACDVVGALVFVDGVERGSAPWTGALGAGEHVVEVRADGYRPAQETVTVTSGAEESVALTLTPVSSAAGAGPRRRISQGLFWSMVGLAVLSAGAATVTGILALQSEAELVTYLDDVEEGRVQGDEATFVLGRQDLVDRTGTLALVTDIAFGVAGAAAITSIVLAFFTRFSQRSEIGLTFSPGLASGGASVLATGRF